MGKITKDMIEKKLDELEEKNPILKLFRANFDMINHILEELREMKEDIKKLKKVN